MATPRETLDPDKPAPITRGQLALLIIGGVLTGGGALTILGFSLAYGGRWVAFAVPAVGIVLFLGMAMLGRFTYPNVTVAEAALRHGLAAGFVGSYLTVLGLSLVKIHGVSVNNSLVKNLTWVVGVVVTFYFGSTTVSQYIAKKQG